MGRRGTDVVSPGAPSQEQYPMTRRDPQIKELPLRSEQVEPHIRHHNAWIQTQDSEPLKHLFGKSMGIKSKRTTEL